MKQSRIKPVTSCNIFSAHPFGTFLGSLDSQKYIDFSYLIYQNQFLQQKIEFKSKLNQTQFSEQFFEPSFEIQTLLKTLRLDRCRISYRFERNRICRIKRNRRRENNFSMSISMYVESPQNLHTLGIIRYVQIFDLPGILSFFRWIYLFLITSKHVLLYLGNFSV